MLIGTSAQLHAANNISCITAGAELKSLGVILDSRLPSADHVSAVSKTCNYHTPWARRHLRHLLILDVANVLQYIAGACLDYCNSLLYTERQRQRWRNVNGCRTPWLEWFCSSLEKKTRRVIPLFFTLAAHQSSHCPRDSYCVFHLLHAIHC